MASPSPSLFMSPEIVTDDDIDDISLISTDQEGGEEEDANKDWFVDDVYAERLDPENSGEVQYLIKWEGFPLDQCTWEPVKNLGPGLLAQWEETKQDIAAGKQKAFDVEEYNAACRAKTERHMRRNAKRRRLGLPLSRPMPAELAVEAQEGEELDPSHVSPETKPQQITKQKTPEKTASPAGKEDNNQHRIMNVRQPSSVSKLSKQGSTITGYQGTARKPSKSTNQRRPGTTLRPSSTLPARPPKPSSSLANKFAGKQRWTATRTHPRPAETLAPVTNIFTGGKERKKRANLGDVMNDPTKAPKAFHSMRVQNIAKKKGIERNDGVPPSISSIPKSFILTSNETDQRKQDQIRTKDPSNPLETPSLTHGSVALPPDSTTVAASAPKAKKSVRFMEAEDVEPADYPMTDAPDPVLDEPEDARHPLAVSEPAKQPPSAPKKLTLANYHGRAQTQVVSKTVVFGRTGSNPIRVLFSGIVRQSQPWLSAFVAQETLHFNTTCVSYDFLSQQPHLLGEILAAGAVENFSNETPSTLANAAANLQRGSLGLHLVADEFSILVYPSACDDWKGLGYDMGTVKPEAPLRHMIYKSQADPKLYPPVPLPRTPVSIDDKEQGSYSRVVIKDLTGLNFAQFLPQEPKLRDNQVFMLLIPEREMQVSNVIKLWLRSYQPDCRIFSHEYKESWSRFHEAVRAGAAGTIIFHEDVTCSIRKIPRIFQMVDSRRCYTFWDLATGQFNPPRFPSDIDASIEPGALQLTRLFPHGRAFLITPSFALSDPERLCQFLDWFQAYCCNPNYLLVACADFPNYLKAVTLEKEEERSLLYKDHRNSLRLEDLLDEFGLRKVDLEKRFRAWQLLKEIIKQYGDGNTSEDIRKVYWITEFIDPNDEQSLVNWFCWWSTTKLDRYRKFTVLGSSAGRNKWAYRNIDIPAYTDTTVSDPDLALSRETQERKAREAVEEAEDAKEFGDDTPATPTNTNSGLSPDKMITQHSRAPYEFRSEIFKSDRADELRGWIAEFNRSRSASWAKLHPNPVSWLGVSMADHFGDSRCAYDTYKNWLGRAPIFSSHVNTWYGLFYTIDKEWNNEVSPNTYGRHPWIAVFRPNSPHNTRVPYKKMELLIWDVSAAERKRVWGRSKLLLDMQYRLANLLREEVPQKCEGYKLDSVYISSKTKLQYSPNDNPLDVTCRRIREMMDDGKFWLPPFTTMLPSRGWDLVEMSDLQESSPAMSSSIPKPTSFPKHHTDKGKPLRSIWHAPSPRAQSEGERSKCFNDLYESAYRARLKDGAVQTMRYQYRPTLEWYHDLKAEGRDASHVNVDSADKVLYKLLQKKN
ncbi:hypothetical protein F4779DRAFT_638786 [Xylariaceae sp. FL0662B]|nr:hypothetical protein F4779DRAFT_638786 [Xylariaceae sp. FL0662B]